MNARLAARSFDDPTGSITRSEHEAALRERLCALGRLSTVIAHEVRNPLMIIKGSLRGLGRENASVADVRELAEDIDRQVARLDRIVSDVLDFARPLRVDPARVDVAALIRDAAGAINDGGEGPPVRLALEPGVEKIVTDGERLRGVLANLLENARDAVRAAGRPGQGIEVGGRRVDGGRVLLWVEDRGAGVAATELPASSSRSSPPSVRERASASPSLARSWRRSVAASGWRAGWARARASRSTWRRRAGAALTLRLTPP